MSTETDEACMYCWGCGKPNAEHKCPCERVSFCNENCKLSGWSAHRFTCPKQPRRVNDEGLSPGDIVLVVGLQQDLTLNGLLGEIRFFDEKKQRHAVLMSAPDRNYNLIERLIKAENLEIKLSRATAAKRSLVLTNVAKAKSDSMLADTSRILLEPFLQTLNSSTETYRQMKSDIESPEEMLELFEKSQFFRLAFWGAVNEDPSVLPDCQRIALLDAGLIDVCLKPFEFPSMLDHEMEDFEFHPFPPALFSGLQALAAILQPSSAGSADFTKHRVEACQKLSPVLMLVSSKKCRIYGSTEYWYALMGSMIDLLFFVVQGEQEIRALISLPANVLLALKETLLLCLTVDLTEFPHRHTFELVCNSVVSREYGAIQIFARLCYANFLENVDEADKAKVGGIAAMEIPSGTKYIGGETFGSCFALIVARTVIRTLEDGGNMRTETEKDHVGKIRSNAEIILTWFSIERQRAMEAGVDIFGDRDLGLVQIYHGDIDFEYLDNKSEKDFVVWSLGSAISSNPNLAEKHARSFVTFKN